MRRSYRRRNQNTIELTSLMDVIFIVLAVVILGYFAERNDLGKKEEEINDREYAVEQEYSRLKDQEAKDLAEKEELENQIESYQYLQDQAVFITVTARYTPSDPKNRTIVIHVNDAEAKEISVEPGTSEASFEEMEAYLTETLGQASGKPVILTYSDTQVLRRDDKVIREMLDDLKDANSNLYENSSDGEANE